MLTSHYSGDPPQADPLLTPPPPPLCTNDVQLSVDDHLSPAHSQSPPSKTQQNATHIPLPPHTHNRGGQHCPCAHPQPQARGAPQGGGGPASEQKSPVVTPGAVRQAVGGGCHSGWGWGYFRLQMPSSLALAIRGTVAGHRLGPLGGGGSLLPIECILGLRLGQATHHRCLTPP